MLTAKFVEERKRDLLREKDRLEQEVRKRRVFEEYGTSEDDNALEVAAYEESLSEIADFQRLLTEVNRALEKIDKGTYGQCETCSEEIETERLEAFPAATVCVKHQKELEHRGAKSWWKPWTWRR